MSTDAAQVKDYINDLSDPRKDAFLQLRDVVRDHLPGGFEETIAYGMISYVVPKTTYPKGYHVNPTAPLPFVSIALQKQFLALYHMGLYADETLLSWFREAYAEKVKHRLDMGKSCVRFKKPNDIPWELIGELMQKVTVDEWISRYESNLKR